MRLVLALHACMLQSGAGPEFVFNADAVRARSVDESAGALEHAQQRWRAAELEAERARSELEETRSQLREVTKDRDHLEATSRHLRKERAALTNENALLLKRISALVTQLAEATGKDRQLQLSVEISQLQRQLDQRNRALYGRSSERRPRSEDGEGEGGKPPRRRRRKRSGGKRTSQPKLPIVEVEHGLTEEEQKGGCSTCHGDLVKMEGQTEDSEEIDVQPIRYALKLHRRQKYRCTSCSGIETAPGPDKLIEGSRYSPALGVQVAIDKYEDSLPLARQVRRMKRAGVTTTTQALWDQLVRMYLLLLPTLLLVHARLLKAAVLYADESPWRMMSNEGGGTKKWWLWVLGDGEGVYFQIVPSRGNAAARELLRDFDGILMSDDFTVYRSLERERERNGGVQQVLDEEGNLVDLWTPNYTLATCWMHARRYLLRAEPYHPEVSPALDLVADLYQVESDTEAEVTARIEAAGRPVPADEARDWLLAARRTNRSARSRALVAGIDDWRKSVVVLEGTALAEAKGHLDRIWDRLVLFLDDPRIPLDNGFAERQVRGPAVGRKNFYGCRSELGARVAALFYSLIGTARNLSLDVHAYLLAAVREAIRNKGATLTPWDYAQRQTKEADADRS